ncbi:MAG: hypothetical protein SCM11_15940 [Bacillota bacterium]|nr:hypothetical protein [Bacillota bacterium]
MFGMTALSTTITIDIMDLLLGLLVLVGIVFGIFLIILLARLAGMMKKVNKLVSSIDEPVTKTVDQLPDLIKKLDGVAGDVSVLTVSAKESVPAMLDDVQTMTGTVRVGVEAIGGAAQSVGEGISSFFRPAKETRSSSVLGSLVDIISQVMVVVSLFAGRDKKQKKGHSKRR